MLILKSLTLENIGRFTEPQTIDFTQLGFLVQVDAENLNTGGSSGAGKSTTFKALEFLLGLNDVSNSVLQSRLTKSAMVVTGIFDYNGIPIKIERGKKLSIELPGELITGSSKLTEEKLDEIIGMPRDLFRKILHKRQGEGGFFLDMGPSDVHKFLTSCQGLDKEQAKMNILDSRLQVLSEQEISLKSDVQSLNSALEATQNAISSLGLPPKLEIDPGAIEGLKTKHTEASNDHKLVKESLKQEMEEFEKKRPQITVIPFDRSRIEQLEDEIHKIVQEINNLEKVELDRQSKIKDSIFNFQIEIGKLHNAETNRQAEVKSKLSSIRAEIQKLQQEEKDRQTSVQTQISKNKVEQIKAQALIKEGDRAKEEALKIGEELKKIKAALCPTCEQSWVTDQAKEKEKTLLSKLSEHKKAVISAMEAAKAIKEFQTQLESLELDLKPQALPKVDNLLEEVKSITLDLEPKTVPGVFEIEQNIAQLKLEAQPQAIPEVIELKLKKDFKNQEVIKLRLEEHEHQTKENSKNQAILTEYAQKQTELRKSHQLTIQEAQDAENKALAELKAAENQLKSFEESKKRFDESQKKLNDQESKYKFDLQLKTADLIKFQEEIELATESKKAIKSYLSCSFEDALESIGDSATKLIRNIPNLSTATIQLEGLKETAQGKVKEEINCVISVDGEIGIPIKSLSGGERSSLDLAIDLAVMEFIQERSGTGTNLLILDEPFTGLDSENIACIVELLKESGINKQILVVDHNPIVKENFESKITVIRDGLTSRIVQQ